MLTQVESQLVTQILYEEVVSPSGLRCASDGEQGGAVRDSALFSSRQSEYPAVVAA